MELPGFIPKGKKEGRNQTGIPGRKFGHTGSGFDQSFPAAI